MQASTFLQSKDIQTTLVPISCLMRRIQLWDMFETRLDTLAVEQPEIYSCLLEMIHQTDIEYEQALNQAQFHKVPERQWHGSDQEKSEQEALYKPIFEEAEKAARKPILKYLQKPLLKPMTEAETKRTFAAQNFIEVFQNNAGHFITIAGASIVHGGITHST